MEFAYSNINVTEKMVRVKIFWVYISLLTVSHYLNLSSQYWLNQTTLPCKFSLMNLVLYSNTHELKLLGHYRLTLLGYHEVTSSYNPCVTFWIIWAHFGVTLEVTFMVFLGNFQGILGRVSQTDLKFKLQIAHHVFPLWTPVEFKRNQFRHS